MKVIFANRSDCITKRGGDTAQMLLTKKYLEANYNLDIELCFSAEELMEKQCDIVHLFNVQTHEESAAFIKVALMKKIKIVLSPIYWNYKYSIFSYALGELNIYMPKRIYQYLSGPAIYFARKLLRNVYLSKNARDNIKFIVNNSNIVLPNSSEELEIIKKHFKIPYIINHAVVPNAVELPPDNFLQQYPKENNLVIQVGTILPGKNQLGTLLALMKDPEIKLCFIGRVQDQKYYKCLLKHADKRGNVIFTGELPAHDVTEFYRKARVHVLPSFGESAALVSLEALRYGCEIVVSNEKFTSVQYYKYDEIAYLCDPYDTKSISKSIFNALEKPKYNAEKINEYFGFFNYGTIAKLTYAAYESVL